MAYVLQHPATDRYLAIIPRRPYLPGLRLIGQMHAKTRALRFARRRDAEAFYELAQSNPGMWRGWPEVLVVREPPWPA